MVEMHYGWISNPDIEEGSAKAVMRILNHMMMKDYISTLKDILNNGRILDLGYGRGILLNMLHEKYQNNNLYGVDNSALDPDRMRYLNGSFIPINADVHNLPFKDGIFDAVITSCMFDLSIYSDKINAQSMLSETHRVLVDKGFYLIHDINVKEKIDPTLSVIENYFRREGDILFSKIKEPLLC